MTLEFTADEVQILRQLITQAINHLGPEIHHTFSREYRAELQQRRDTLVSMQERLDKVPAETTV